MTAIIDLNDCDHSLYNGENNSGRVAHMGYRDIV